MSPLTRRQFIGAAAGLTVVAGGLALPARGLAINPRSSWGDDLPPKGPLPGEDVEFLIVHHSASHNGHTGADTPAILRSWYHFHTGEKGWNDVAYNFVIDADGGVWEARAGSLDGPVAGDATGGNQGFTQLVCLIGDYNSAEPSVAARASLVQVLAWLSDRYGVSTAEGAEVTFTSRGSNKWPAGTSVTTPTITGHRTMSNTTCPGDSLYSYVTGTLRSEVAATRGGAAPAAATTSTSSTTPTTSVTTTSTTTTVPPTTTTSVPPTTTTSTTTTVAPPTTTATPSTTPSVFPADDRVAVGPVEGASGAFNGLLATAGTMMAVGTALVLWRYRRLSEPSTARHRKRRP